MGKVSQCPWSMDDEVWVCMSWWREWKSLKILPWGGTDIMDQPAFVMEAIQCCEDAANEWQLGKIRQTEAEQKSMLDQVRGNG